MAHGCIDLPGVGGQGLNRKDKITKHIQLLFSDVQDFQDFQYVHDCLWVLLFLCLLLLLYYYLSVLMCLLIVCCV